MSNAAIVLCGGLGERWKTGIKQLMPAACGRPIITRIIQQFATECDVVVMCHPDKIDDISNGMGVVARLLCRTISTERILYDDRTCTLATLLAGLSCSWNEELRTTHVLLGDVMFTDESALRIMRCSPKPILFHTDGLEVFGASFVAEFRGELKDRLMRLIDLSASNPKLCAAKMWNLLRDCCGLPQSNASLSPRVAGRLKFVNLIADETQDFDTQEQYADWLMEKSKNRAFYEHRRTH